MTIKKLAKDLKPGDKFRLPPEVATVKSVKDLNTRLPTQTSNLLLVEANAASGPYRGKDGEFVISGDQKVEVMPLAPWPQRLLKVAKKNPESLFVIALVALCAAVYYGAEFFG